LLLPLLLHFIVKSIFSLILILTSCLSNHSREKEADVRIRNNILRLIRYIQKILRLHQYYIFRGFTSSRANLRREEAFFAPSRAVSFNCAERKLQAGQWRKNTAKLPVAQEMQNNNNNALCTPSQQQKQHTMYTKFCLTGREFMRGSSLGR